MHFFTIASLLAVAATQTGAQDSSWSKQSVPFNLVLKSHNATLDGTYLGACHEGAAIEGLCPYGKTPRPYEQFYFNTSMYRNSTSDDFQTQGLLTWNLPIGDTMNISSSMQLFVDPLYNVAIPLLFPGSDQYNVVTWSNHSKLLIGYYEGPKEDRWYICTTHYSYTYQTLAWIIGKGKPENPTCQKVSVHRKLV